jgi:hypothetical protein
MLYLDGSQMADFIVVKMTVAMALPAALRILTSYFFCLSLIDCLFQWRVHSKLLNTLLVSPFFPPIAMSFTQCYFASILPNTAQIV